MMSVCCSNLTTWAENGVLLLNTALTVRAHEAASHSKKGWDEFTAKVVDVVDRYGGANLGDKSSSDAGRGRGIVFLVWGAHAAKVVAKLNKVGARLFLPLGYKVSHDVIGLRSTPPTEEAPHFDERCESPRLIELR